MSPRYRSLNYTWEAVYAADFTLDHVRRRGAMIAAGVVARGWSCLVAYDTRFMGNLFARALYADLLARGVQARLAACPTPLPAVYAALERKLADCALVVTARKRPYYYNGLVLIAPPPGMTLGVPDEQPQSSFPPLIDPAPLPPDLPDLRAEYLESLRGVVDLDLIRRVSMTIFVDPMNGTTAGGFTALLGDGGQTRAIEINREPDPHFAKVTPHPAESGLLRLKKLVRESDSHLGLAISADGTALAVIDKSGEQVNLTEVALLLSSYLVRQHRHKGLVLLPPPASDTAFNAARLAAWEEATGIKLELTLDTDARIAELLAQDRPGLLLGLNRDGEISIGRVAAYPDALLAGLLVTEMVARSGGSLRALLDAQRDQLK
ncbi:phosphoglucomutase/phosphomannomutase alpha/beta/alpha domain II [Oscillochloris trichoides DG-6]|uniref:Phosphoglucomutase/phosphomannomutase alpha/beta/alpha domain II n=1 Tax=Oscillochloris trichoides DG-6 TaxID=765420 RepID=E1IIH5_9CHLR|nr:phosphoglucomutase/phosphomannomutase alpha/beta/alpha domain II [Oscillochloris trichoides]EFO79050.1 phosphoglucomutase/phosphomannomutase alpha/beta/alpha domain II [Oscillochloris trichoides DG-6]